MPNRSVTALGVEARHFGDDHDYGATTDRWHGHATPVGAQAGNLSGQQFVFESNQMKRNAYTPLAYGKSTRTSLLGAGEDSAASAMRNPAHPLGESSSDSDG
jgi:hypothetical protein